MTCLPASTSGRKLGLVIDLDTCVGCQACVTACKGWNDRGARGPEGHGGGPGGGLGGGALGGGGLGGGGLGDADPYGPAPVGAFLNRVHCYEVEPEAPPAEAPPVRAPSAMAPPLLVPSNMAPPLQTPPPQALPIEALPMEAQTIEAGSIASPAAGPRTVAPPATEPPPPAMAAVARCSVAPDHVEVVNFPRSCLHCEAAPCVTVCPTGASYKRAEDGIVLVNADACIGCGLCAWACPYGAREMDPLAGVMRKCTLCVDRIYDPALPEADRIPACVRTCPTGARHFGDLGDPQSAVSRLVASRGGLALMPGQGTKPVNRYLPPRPKGPGQAPALVPLMGGGHAGIPVGTCAGLHVGPDVGSHVGGTAGLRDGGGETVGAGDGSDRAAASRAAYGRDQVGDHLGTHGVVHAGDRAGDRAAVQGPDQGPDRPGDQRGDPGAGGLAGWLDRLLGRIG
ncbi:4Fe-4S dicluster domain-containing protein [Rhodobacteraceae bacterium PA1-206B]